MKKTYLGILFHEDRKLGFAVGVFIALTIFSNFAKLEMTPFFLWGMYSEKESAQEKFTVLEIRVNNDSLINYSGSLPDNTRFFLSSPVQRYQEIQKNKTVDSALDFFREKNPFPWALVDRLARKVFNDTASLRKFPDWYARYLSRVTGQKVNGYTVSAIDVHFDSRMFLVTDSRRILLNRVDD